MPKLKKARRNKQATPIEDKQNYAYKSIVISIILSLACLTISLFFNGELISITLSGDAIWKLIDIIIKVFSILMFFLFVIIVIGNYKELTGKPMNWKELLFVFIISLIQSILNLTVFIITLIGLILVIIYLYLSQ
ncbi:MAG: conserved membrane protein of unknown function [Promethearchaeota archaeon]|nr:MAG: conserved membrane protein of unknown function [Candidatus Lokiarchaeota archaeon]